MTSQGTAYGRFQRAIARGHLLHAELAAREIGWLNLGDALALTVLIAKEGESRYGRAAARWHARFAAEAKGLESWESLLVLAALAALPHDEEIALPLIQRLVRKHGIGVDAASGTRAARYSP